jgi:thiamine biosynthesis lipoprotein
MGTSYNVTILPTAPEIDATAISEGIAAQLEQVNKVASTYQSDSELMLFNVAEVGAKVALSTELFELFSISSDLYTSTDGALDVTIGPLVELWGFGARERGDDIPSDLAIEQALAKAGFDNLELFEAEQSARRNTDLAIDLSAVAKGYAVDKVAEYLESQGVVHYLVEVGGELRTRGLSPSARPWRIGIESPSLLRAEPIEGVSVSGKALATSGDYRNYFEQEGVRYSHTLDPRTGRPITHRLASVTVIDDTSARADGLATGLNVLGYELAQQTCNRLSLACYFVIYADEGFEIKYTSEFEQYLN